MRSLRAYLLLGFLTGSMTADAVEPHAPKPSEIARMPDYCQVKLTGGSDVEQRSWAGKFGALWGDLHHYCQGLKFIQRASRPGIPQSQRSYNLTASLNEFNYILRSKNVANGHWFLPEVHIQRAMVYRRLGRYKEATAEMQKAQAARK